MSGLLQLYSDLCMSCALLYSCRGSGTGILPHKFLGPIVYWTLKPAAGADSSSAAAGSPAAAAPALPSTGNRKKQRKAQSQQQIMGAGQGSTGILQSAWLLPELLSHLEFTDEVDYVVSTIVQHLLQWMGCEFQTFQGVCCLPV